MGPPDAILGIAQAFRACTDDRKVNVCVGAYRDEKGQPWVLPSVRAAETKMMSTISENKEYLPIEGDADFIQKALQFAYGADAPLDRIAGVQTLSGTGACRIGGTFLAKFLPANTKIYIPVPTWGNHWNIMADAGLPAEAYRYYSRATNGLDYDGMMEDIEQAPEGVLSSCMPVLIIPPDVIRPKTNGRNCVRYSNERIILHSLILPIKDLHPVMPNKMPLHYDISVNRTSRSCWHNPLPKTLVCTENDVGLFPIVCPSADTMDKVMSQLKLIIRPMYSSPPKHGSSIVRTVLSDETLTAQYYTECKSMADRIAEMRTKFVQALAAAGSKHDWSHVTHQIGMFAFTGMSAAMVTELTDTYAIYLTKDGRISVGGTQ
jgi:aspartate aminotransferase